MKRATLTASPSISTAPSTATPFEGGKAESSPVDLGAGRMLADFEAGLRGAKAGDKKDIELTFPANYAANLAGKQAKFAVTVHKVEERQLPELNDEFAKIYGVEEGGIERLRSEAQENMERELGEAIKARVKKQILDGLLEAQPIELPKSMVDAQVRELQLDAARRMGARDASQIPPPEGFQEPARRRVALSLLIGEIIRNANIQVDQAQVQTRFEELAAAVPGPGSGPAAVPHQSAVPPPDGIGGAGRSGDRLAHAARPGRRQAVEFQGNHEFRRLDSGCERDVRTVAIAGALASSKLAPTHR